MNALIDRCIAWSIQRRVFVVLAAIALLLVGAYRAIRAPLDVFPDLTAPTVTVIAEAHGMAPEEVESLVTLPLENSMNGAAGVRRVRSSTGIGIAIVWVEFEGDFDVYRARQIVSEKLQLAQAALPPDVPRPVLAPISSIMGEIEFIALRSDRHDAMELKTTADWVLRRRLLSVAGVAQVIPTGGETKQYQVLVHPERLAAYRIGMNEVLEALRGTNQNTSAGFYVSGAQEYLIHAVGRVRTLEDIGSSVVVARDGHPILVRELAEVKIAPALKRGEGSHDATPAVIIGIQKQPGANTLELTKRLDAVLDDLQATLPEGMRIERHVFRQSDFIETAIANVRAALRDGALLVLVIVALFLASSRATLITVLAIPLSLAVAVLVLTGFGATINTMTLGGMAIAVGELVDDAIIDVENVARRLRENAGRGAAARPTIEVVYEASREVRGSVVFATLVILLVFLPLFFLPGVEGRLLRPLGAAYAVALAASLFVALTVTPALATMLLPRSRAIRSAREGLVVRGLRAVFDRVLAVVLPRWRILSALAIVAVAVAGIALSRTGRAFLPDFNEGSLTLSVVTLPGTSLEESDRIGRRIEQILLAQPEVSSTARRTGRAELDEHAQDVNAAEIDVGLSFGRPHARSKQALLESLRTEFSMLPGTNVTIGQPISHRIDHMLSGTRANLAVKIFGDDLAELRRVGEEVRGIMRAVPGVVDLSIEQQADIPMLTVKLDRDAVAQHGLRTGEVAELLEAALAGQSVSRVRERQTSFDLVVRLDRGALADLDTLKGTLLSTSGGAMIPLDALADVRKDTGPNTIARENVQRKLVVMCNVGGRDLGGVVDDIRARVGAQVKLARGYRIEYGGQFEAAEEATRTLLGIGALVLCGVVALLIAGLRSTRDALLVLINLPLALVGGVVGVYVSGGVLSVASLVGFITLFGIATRNGIMLVSHVHHLIDHEGITDRAEAVRRGASERLAPILMTALAAGLALVPLALGAGHPGSEIQAPMAIVILFGLFSSTTLNMLVLPALYLRFGAFRGLGEAGALQEPRA